MPRNASITVPRGQTVELTSADIADFTVAVTGPARVILSASPNATAPTDPLAGMPVPPGGSGFYAMDDWFKGVTSPARLFAHADEADTAVFISHA